MHRMFCKKQLLLALYAVFVFCMEPIGCQQSSSQVEKIEMNPIEPKPGESVKIRCYLKNVDPTKKIKPDILWSFRERDSQNWRIIGNGASITDSFNNRLSGRKESDEVFEIIFRPIQETDVGTVKCEITNTEGQIFKIQDLNVFSPPYITSITQDIYAKVGSKVTLECLVDGFPKPIVQWTRLGELSAVFYGTKFEITSIGKEDRGTYRCYAENITPINKIKQTAEAFVTVTIDFPPSIRCDNDAVYQVPGINADAEINCVIEGFPLNNVRWYFYQQDFNIETEIRTDQYHKIENIASPDSIKSLLVIRNVNNDNFGGYTIKVEGGQQEIIQKTVLLQPAPNPEGYLSKASKQYSSYMGLGLAWLLAFLLTRI
jgi:hypothetical protein